MKSDDHGIISVFVNEEFFIKILDKLLNENISFKHYDEQIFKVNVNNTWII